MFCKNDVKSIIKLVVLKLLSVIDGYNHSGSIVGRAIVPRSQNMVESHVLTVLRSTAK